MHFDRTDRISEEVRHALDRIIREDVRDPRVTGTYSITRAEVTRDLRYAKVRVSVLEEDKRKPLIDALKSAAGFIRRELGHRVNLRYTPQLLFEVDQNIEYGVHIAKVLHDATTRKEDDVLVDEVDEVEEFDEVDETEEVHEEKEDRNADA